MPKSLDISPLQRRLSEGIPGFLDRLRALDAEQQLLHRFLADRYGEHGEPSEKRRDALLMALPALCELNPPKGPELLYPEQFEPELRPVFNWLSQAVLAPVITLTQRHKPTAHWVPKRHLNLPEAPVGVDLWGDFLEPIPPHTMALWVAEYGSACGVILEYFDWFSDTWREIENAFEKPTMTAFPQTVDRRYPEAIQELQTEFLTAWLGPELDPQHYRFFDPRFVLGSRNALIVETFEDEVDPAGPRLALAASLGEETEAVLAGLQQSIGKHFPPVADTKQLASVFLERIGFTSAGVPRGFDREKATQAPVSQLLLPDGHAAHKDPGLEATIAEALTRTFDRHDTELFEGALDDYLQECKWRALVAPGMKHSAKADDWKSTDDGFGRRQRLLADIGDGFVLFNDWINTVTLDTVAKKREVSSLKRIGRVLKLDWPLTVESFDHVYNASLMEGVGVKTLDDFIEVLWRLMREWRTHAALVPEVREARGREVLGQGLDALADMFE